MVRNFQSRSERASVRAGPLAPSALRIAPWLVALCLTTPLPASETFCDPPAIEVFPEHEQALSGAVTVEEFIEDGFSLFGTVFNRADGVGRPNATGDSKPTIRPPPRRTFERIAGPDASSCAGCHNQPLMGGSGDFVANVFVGAHFIDPPPEEVRAEITSERNTISVFGAGAIEVLAREMTDDLQQTKRAALLSAKASGGPIRTRLVTKGVHFGTLVAFPDGTWDPSGVTGIDTDLVVKPFGVKGVAVSIREFTIFALNQHHGIQPIERFGWSRTGVEDFDGDGFSDEFSVGQTSAISIFQASLPAPRVEPYEDPARRAQATRGGALFDQVGCTSCHRPTLPLRSLWFFEPNPYNRPGAATPTSVGGAIGVPLPFAHGTGLYRAEDGTPVVAAFTDLKRHVICDAEDMHFCNERVRQDFVATDQFLTAKLWDAGSSAPYGHRGDLTTLSEAIVHHSGEAKVSKQAFLDLPDEDKRAIILFLRSLRVGRVDNLDTWRSK